MNSSTGISDSSQPRCKLFVGSLALAILLTGGLIVGLDLTERFNQYGDIRPWLYLWGPVFALFSAFSVRLFRWCNWKHLLLCLIPSLGIAAVVFSQLFQIGFDDHQMYLALGILVGMIIAPGLLGMGIASGVSRLATTTKRRWLALLMVITVIASVPTAQWLGWNVYAWYTSAHAETAGKAHLRAKAQELQHSHVVSTLDTPISKGRNLIWCATFQVAWNELCILAGEDIRMEPEDPSVVMLNRKEAKKEHLDAETYYVKAGSADNSGFDQIRQALDDKFKGAASPELLPAKSSLPPGAFMAYAYLFANLPFEWAFDRHEFPFKFGGANVESFGIAQYMESQKKERLAAPQIRIYSNNEKDVIIELKTRRTDHHLYLAMVPPLTTLGETAKDVLSRVKRVEPSSLREMMSLIVPVIDFDLTRDYEELTDRPLRVKKFDGQPIGIAKQQIRFKLDERGAVLKSEAIIETIGVSPDILFNKPFLVLLQYQDNEMPYFAAWIDNPELLIKK
jgi:uncharacterized membrane protein YhaH (DUF805 family)